LPPLKWRTGVPRIRQSRKKGRRATINGEQGRGGKKDRGGEGGKGEEREDMKRGEKHIQF
jgi:hypothetical protein